MAASDQVEVAFSRAPFPVAEGFGIRIGIRKKIEPEKDPDSPQEAPELPKGFWFRVLGAFLK